MREWQRSVQPALTLYSESRSHIKIEIELDLSPQHTGQIRLLLTNTHSNAAAETALTNAHHDIENIGGGRAQKATETIDNAQTMVSSQSGTFDALGAVLLKIDRFVDIVDKTANVSSKAIYGLASLTCS